MANDRNASIILQIKSDLAQLQTTARSMNVLTKEEQAAERQALSLAQNLGTLDAKLGQAAQGAQRVKDALKNATYVDPKQAISAYNQIIALEKQAAKEAGDLGPALPRTLESFGTEALDQIKSGLIGVIGPAALATSALAAVKGAIDFTEESFKLKAALDTTNQSIDIQLRGVRQSGIVFADAQRFADKYKLTQAETAEAIQASIPILRQSNASLSDVESTLLRLQAKKPEKSIADAARALDELKSGQIVSIVDQFNVSRDAANAMKNEIAAGGDAVTVLSNYLTNAGIGMDALAIRTQGATGKMNELKVETEKFQLALGGESGGLGLAVLETRIRSTAGATRVLTGDFQGMKEGGQSALQGLIAGLESGNPVAQALGQAIDTLTGNTKALTPAADAAATGVLRSADADDRVAAAAAAAKGPVDQLTGALLAQANATGLADQRKGEQTGTDLSAKQFDSFSKLARTRNNEIADEKKKADDKAAADAKRAADKAAADAKRLDDLQNQNKLIHATTTSAKIAELEREKAATTDPFERQQLQNLIDQERLSSAKAHTGELNKQLTVQESIYDSINKQRDAELDLEELRIKGRQADRDAAVKDRTAQRVIAALGGRTDARANDLRGRAEDVIALDDVERRKRAQEEIEKQATAGGTITKSGKLLQSVPGNGSTPQQVGPQTPVGAGLPSAPAAGASPAGAGGMLVLTDAAGTVLAKLVSPLLMDELIKGVRTVGIQRGG